MELVEELLKQYLSLQLRYVDFEKYIKNKIENLMIENKIKYQNLTGRVKDLNSLKLKLIYNLDIAKQLDNNIQNLNDLCGIRIVLYDNKQFEHIYNIINAHFNIVYCTNRRFGYNANNITVKLKSEVYNNFKCEIQLVTVMSHNLIEIGHDIFYKDLNKLKEKDEIEYSELEKEYQNCLDSVYELETRIDTLKKRKENILQNYELLDKILSTKYIHDITSNNSMNLFYGICNDIMSIAPYLSRKEYELKKFYDKKIIIEIANNLLNVKKNDTIFSEEFIFENFLNVLDTYYNLWINDANKVLDIIIEYISSRKDERMEKSFYNMIKNIISTDIRNKSWNSFEKIREWILKSTKQDYYRVKMINSIVQNCLEYSDYVDSTTISLTRKELEYNENGKEIILKLFSYACDLFIKNQKQGIYKEIISLTYKFDFLANEILNIFYDNYEKIHDYYRYDLIRNIYYSFKEIVLDTKYFNKIKEDKFYSIWKYICYDYFDEEIERKNKNQIYKRAKRVINKYIRDINNVPQKEIIRIIKNYNKMVKEGIFISAKIKKILFLIGKNFDKASRVYENNKNEYLYLGIRSKKEKIKKRNDIKVLKAIENFLDKSIFEECIKENKREIERDILICNIIANNHSLYKTKKYIKRLFQIIRFYNNNNKSLLYNQTYLNDDFVERLNINQCNDILNNYFICLYEQKNIIGLDINLFAIFKKFPNQCRLFFEDIINKKEIKDFKFFNMYTYDPENYNEERKNNILFIINLLKKKNYYEIYRVIDAIVKVGDVNLIGDLLEIVDNTDDEEDLKAISILLNHLELGLSIWEVARKIIKKSSNKEIEKNLLLAMEEIGVVSSLFEAHKSRREQVKKICKKEKDKKCKDFLNKVNKDLQILIDFEELNEKEMKYKMKIENEKFKKDGEKDKN